MRRILTSWKEIAQYAEKGVRTVQRWEQNLGLPVRRHPQNRRSVIAFANEIDSWRNSHFLPSAPKSQLEELRQEVARLSAENQDLRGQLASFQKAKRKSSTQL